MAEPKSGGSPVLPYTGREFLDSLDDGREVWIYGERVKNIAAHRFSYEWARHSTAGKIAQRWWTTMRTAPAGPFWTFVGATGVPGPPAPGAKLFTQHQLIVLSNLPGEIS